MLPIGSFCFRVVLQTEGVFERLSSNTTYHRPAETISAKQPTMDVDELMRGIKDNLKRHRSTGPIYSEALEQYKFTIHRAWVLQQTFAASGMAAMISTQNLLGIIFHNFITRLAVELGLTQKRNVTFQNLFSTLEPSEPSMLMRTDAELTANHLDKLHADPVTEHDKFTEEICRSRYDIFWGSASPNLFSQDKRKEDGSNFSYHIEDCITALGPSLSAASRSTRGPGGSEGNFNEKLLQLFTDLRQAETTSNQTQRMLLATIQQSGLWELYKANSADVRTMYVIVLSGTDKEIDDMFYVAKDMGKIRSKKRQHNRLQTLKDAATWTFHVGSVNRKVAAWQYRFRPSSANNEHVFAFDAGDVRDSSSSGVIAMVRRYVNSLVTSLLAIGKKKSKRLSIIKAISSSISRKTK